MTLLINLENSFDFAQFSHSYPFLSPGANPGSQFAFICHIS